MVNHIQKLKILGGGDAVVLTYSCFLGVHNKSDDNKNSISNTKSIFVLLPSSAIFVSFSSRPDRRYQFSQRRLLLRSSGKRPLLQIVMYDQCQGEGSITCQ